MISQISKKPVLFLCAENDWTFPDKDVDAAEILLKSRKDADSYKFVRYPGCIHGFAVRGDDKDPVVQKAKQDATVQACNFFNSNL